MVLAFFLTGNFLLGKTNSASSILIGKTMNCTSVLHEEKAEVLNNSFASVFTGNPSSHKSWLDAHQDGDWENKVPPTLSEDQVIDHLNKLNVYKSLGPN